ncbi:DUF2441 domain-containing protein [Paraburkholderia tropica]|uniref:DUF2441 domain-containing protein n=1 Tax=Paraburkholderia tropica TaxID=92647 RepID=UPI00160C25AC|nr:DUF2441 domain-containing protein [Paraburkholderia tropica]MBB2984461.1 hypothetical protein [Paraburkholderia tropica]
MDYFSVDRRNAYRLSEPISLETNRPPRNEIEAHIFSQFPNGFSRHGAQFFRDAPAQPQTPDDVNSGYIELLLELIRRAHYPDKPSRYVSMFATDALERAQQFRATNGHPSHGIYVLRTDGAVHRGDMHLLKFEQSVAATEHRLHLYWQGRTFDGVPNHVAFWEYVLALPVQVAEKVACGSGS